MKREAIVMLLTVAMTFIMAGCGSREPQMDAVDTQVEDAVSENNEDESIEPVAPETETVEETQETSKEASEEESQQESDKPADDANADDEDVKEENKEKAKPEEKAQEEAPKQEDAPAPASAGNPATAGIGSVSVAGAAIVPGADFGALAPSLGTPTSYQTAINCEGLGEDKIYTFGGSKFYTQPNGVTDILYLVELSGGAKTSGGLGCGNTVDEIKAACGAPASDDGRILKYNVNGVTVDFYYSGNSINMVELY